MARCTAASKRSKERCKRYASIGRSVCHIHGGKSLRGVASPTFKHGRHSKDLPTRLAARYEERINDPCLLELRSEIALVEARIADLLSRVDSGESGQSWKAAHRAFEKLMKALADHLTEKEQYAVSALGDALSHGQEDYAAWHDLGVEIDRKRRLSEYESKRLVEARQMIPLEQALVMITALTHAVRKHVTDRETLVSINAEFSRLLHQEVADGMPETGRAGTCNLRR